MTVRIDPVTPRLTRGGEICASPSRLALRVLSDEDVARLHAAALALLGRDARDAERAAALAPRSFLLAGQDIAHDVRVDDRCLYLAAGGPASEVQPAGGRPRAACEADLAEACRLADALPEVSCLVGPPLRTAELTPLAELRCCLEATRKHVQIVRLASVAEAEGAVAMARAVVGDASRLAVRPPLSLRASGDGLAAAEVFARAGLPVGLVLEAGDGEEEGLGLAGRLVRHHAGVLAACRAVESHAPGAAFSYVVPPAQAASGESAADALLLALGALQLAAHVGLPASVAALATGAGGSDWQSCADNALAALGVAATCGAIVSGAGTLCGGRLFSARQLVMDAEIFACCTRIAAGIPVDDETMALEVIKKVGIGGNYLGQRHTRRHGRRVWRPRLLDRSLWDERAVAGGEGPPERADALVGRLLDSHVAAPLNARAQDALARIVAEFVDEA